MYEPLKVFTYIGLVVLLVGGFFVARFLYFYFSGSGGGHVQSLVLAGAVVAVGFQILLIGLLADLIGANRRLLEDTLFRLKRLESGLSGRAVLEQDELVATDKAELQEGAAINCQGESNDE